MTTKNIIQLQGIEKRFGKFVAVSNLDLDLREGEFFSLLGPSGCGKTTALRMIAGFQEPSAGKVIIDGEDTDAIHQDVRVEIETFVEQAKTKKIEVKLLKLPEPEAVAAH